MTTPRAPRLKQLAAEIEKKFPELRARIERGFCNTDRKIGRLRWPGKGRHGNRLIVVDRKSGKVVFDHNAAETYRANSDVVRWIERREQDR